MDLQDLKEKTIRNELKISDSFDSILVFIDFANVNYWFEEDEYDEKNKILPPDKKLNIDIKKLKEFSSIFTSDIRFYYGHDPVNIKSLGFLMATKKVFGKSNVFTKPIQKIRHYITEQETISNTRSLEHDTKGDFIRIPKCNFDVEICVDAIKLLEKYDTFCLFSSDADFVHLVRFLKKKGKKVILVKGGYIHHSLHKVSDLIINAQDIKKYIAVIKQKPSC
jgi:uncharacterized LabA/DUF88 family protein